MRIEKEAMRAVFAWCEQNNLEWDDVSLERRGWDVEAREGGGVLRIEVKGSSAPIGNALLELTPNEFAKMTSEMYRDSYRLAVVSVLVDATTLFMFAWSRDVRAWIAEGGTYEVRLKKVVSASVEVVVSSDANDE